MKIDQERGSVAEAIDRLLGVDGLGRWVAAYFHEETNFAGATFNTLGNNEPNRITVDDLLAVSLLDTPIRPQAVRGLLGRDGQAKATLALETVGDDVDIWARPAAAKHDAAGELWDWLQDYNGLGPVRAGKLLARKRPRLIPVVDRVVIRALNARAGGYWQGIGAALGDKTRQGRIEALRPRGVPKKDVPTLRLLDVAIWMTHSQSKSAKSVRNHSSSAPHRT